jgi:hypothetical protein
MKNSERNKLFITAAFAGSMGVLEAIVVYYLRLLYYPAGFSFPIVVMPDAVSSAEMVREAATIIMLAMVAMLTGKDNTRRFVMFLYMFGIWDIFYYLGLKVLVDWPVSLLTWDLLFLIPLPWAAPVLAPVICSLFFIITAVTFTVIQKEGKSISPGLREWIFLVSGVVLILYTFLADSVRTLRGALSEGGFTKTRVAELIQHYTPERYRWTIFIIGAAMLFAFLFSTVWRAGGTDNKK